MAPSILTVLRKALAQSKIPTVDPKHVNETINNVIRMVLQFAPARTKFLAQALDKRNPGKPATLVKLLDTGNDLAKENGELKLALSAAIGRLYVFEPGDSRAISDLFVALSSVEAGNANEACWDIINDTIAEQKRLFESGELVSGQFEPTISIKIGKGDRFMLPSDVVDNQTVCKIVDYIATIPTEVLRLVTKHQMIKMAGLDVLPEEVDEALSILKREDVAILRDVWVYFDPLSGDEYELEPEDRETIANENIFVHPKLGISVADFRKDLIVYWGIDAKNAEFKQWHAERRMG